MKEKKKSQKVGHDLLMQSTEFYAEFLQHILLLSVFTKGVILTILKID